MYKLSNLLGLQCVLGANSSKFGRIQLAALAVLLLLVVLDGHLFGSGFGN